MKKVLSIIAALTIVTSLTACGSGTQPEPSADISSQTATEAATENSDTAQVIDLFEGVTLKSNGDYPMCIDYILEPDDHILREKPYLYNATILSADTKGMTVEISLDMEKLQPVLSEKNYRITEEKKIFELPVEQMDYAAIVNKDQLDRCKSDLLKKAEKDVDINFTGQDFTYQLQESLAILPHESTVFVENAKPEQVSYVGKRTSSLIIFRFERSDGMEFVAYGIPCLKKDSFADYLNNDQRVFSVVGFDSDAEATEYINNMVGTDDGSVRVDFTID